jgi:NAD(P)-dependent dehydrogenase (short-subunit alcohol dehydrogenase family)
MATMDFTGKTAIVTGAASGMGAACARALRDAGADVVVVDRNAEGLATIGATVDAVAIQPGDVGNSAFCDMVVASTAELTGSVDIVVNAAGIIVRSTGEETSDDAWAGIFSANVDGVFFMCRAAVSAMKHSGGGAIVNFGSIWGDVGSAGHTAYAATKGAVHQITRSMALEHARDGIRINAVCPGEINTPMLASEREHPPTPEELAALADSAVPMGRLGEPEEVAAVVVFLASDAASYMTGSMVTVDAGYTAR